MPHVNSLCRRITQSLEGAVEPAVEGHDVVLEHHRKVGVDLGALLQHDRVVELRLQIVAAGLLHLSG